MYTKTETKALIAWATLWLVVAVLLALFDDSRAADACAVPGVQAATVTEVYANGSTRTLVGRVLTWRYSAGAMHVAYRSDGIAIAGFE